MAPKEETDPSFSGTAFANNAAALEQIVGPAVMAEAVASLDEADRERVLDAHALPWVPVTVHERLAQAVARCANRDYDELVDVATRKAAERGFKTVWSVLIEFTSNDETLVTRTAAIYARIRNVGTMCSRVTGEGESESELTGWPSVSDRQLRTLAIGIEAVLHLAGRTDARVASQRTPDGGRFSIRWSA